MGAKLGSSNAVFRLGTNSNIRVNLGAVQIYPVVVTPPATQIYYTTGIMGYGS